MNQEFREKDITALHDILEQIRVTAQRATNHDDVDTITHGRVAGMAEAALAYLSLGVLIPEHEDDDLFDDVDEEVIDG